MATAYLQRTLTGGNQRTFTISFWVKRNALGTGTMISYAQTPGNTSHARGYMNFASDALYFAFNPTGSSWWSYNVSNRLFRDTSAWYHLVARVDTTDASASNRLKIYVNGEQQTLNSTIGTQDLETGWNNNSYTLRVGEYAGDGGENFDGQFAHFYYVDGTAYDASTFGETDSTTGIWKPKLSPTITYGTNGFLLKFENSAAMGTDSGGSNNLTVSGTVTKLIDTPTNVFATLNPSDIGYTSNLTLSNNNNTTNQTSNWGDYGIRSTLAATTGKYYWEAKIATSNTLCIIPMETRLVVNLSDGSPANDLYGVQRYSDSTTNIYNDGTFTQNSSAMWGGITSSDIISFALDLDNGKLFLAKNGDYKNTSGATGDPVNGTNPTFTISDTTKTYGFYTEMRGNDNNGTLMNFGNGYFGTTPVTSAQNPDDGRGIFEYDVPAGYRALCTKSINAEEYS